MASFFAVFYSQPNLVRNRQRVLAQEEGGLRMSQITLTNVARQARIALDRSRIYVLRRLSIQQDGDALILSGRVDSFYHKQLAQEVVRAATDGMEVENAISVVYSDNLSDRETSIWQATGRPDRPR